MKVVPMSKCLDKKLLLFGFEMADLFLIFITLSILNLFFGRTDQKILLVWLPPTLMALGLKLGKKGKPDNYLIHWLRFQFSPGLFSAFLDPANDKIAPNLRGLK